MTGKIFEQDLLFGYHHRIDKIHGIRNIHGNILLIDDNQGVINFIAGHPDKTG